MAVGLPLLLFTGVTLNLVSQVITDAKFADPRAHIVPWVKFCATLIFAVASRLRQGPAPHAPTPEQHRLMALIGVLDVGAYVTFCQGFTVCGAATSSVVLAASGQVCTALATRFVLGKRLSGGQAAAIAAVCAGLALRALPPAAFGGGGPAAVPLTPEQVWGVWLVVAASVLYSGLGVTYEKLITATGKPPHYADLLWYTSRIGVAGATAYQLIYTLPRWGALVAAPAAASGATAGYILPLLAAFAALFNVHMFAQTLVFKSDGAMGVGLVNAVRGAIITAISAAMFCSPERPWMCLTRQAGLSAAVTAVGGVAWVVAGVRAKGAAAGVQPIDGKTKEL